MSDTMFSTFTPFAAVSAFGSILGGRADAKNLRDQAEIAEENADIVKLATDRNVAIERHAGRVLEAQQTVAFLNSGVTLTGTPENVIVDSAKENELNALAILYSGRLDEAAHRASAKSLRDRAKGSILGGNLTGLSKIL